MGPIVYYNNRYGCFVICNGGKVTHNNHNNHDNHVGTTTHH